MPPRRSSRTSQSQQDEGAEIESNDLFRGSEDASMDERGDSFKATEVDADVGLTGNEEVTKDYPTSNPAVDVDMQDAAAPQPENSEPTISKQQVDIPTEMEDEMEPQVASTSEEQIGADTSMEKNDIPSTLSRDEPITSSQSGELLASLPVYMSNSLPSSSTLQVFQYPTYPKGHPLPFPQSARERGLQAAMRTRPRAKRVEVELPLDLRPPVYNADRGEEFGEGATAAGPIEPGPKGTNGPSSAMKGSEKRVKSEFTGFQSISSSDSSNRKKLERTRLESLLMPHQTKYMLGVIRDKAVHLTPVDSVHQLRPSMHYIDALEALKRQQDKALEEQNRAEDEDDEDARPNGAGSNAQKARKAQSLNVSFRNDGSSSSANRQGAGGGGAGGDSRDYLMQAEREAESEKWISLDWKMDEKSDEARKTFDSHLFAVDKTTRLQCKTKPREYLKM